MKNCPNISLVIASRNIHKIRELRSFLRGVSNLDILNLLDFPNYNPPEETGSSFEENASLKALSAAKALKSWSIADDSGLTVPALNNRPGIFSSRFASNKASDVDNRKKLLQEMSNLQDQERFAYFTCCLVIANEKGMQKIGCALCEGTIATEERGRGGFGYDALFIKHGYNKTFAELEESTKNRISHRSKAFEKLIPFLETL